MEEKFILFGAKKAGENAAVFFKARGMENLVYSFCDKDYENISSVQGIEVKSYEAVKNIGNSFIVTVGNEDAKREIIHMLKKDGQRFYADMPEWIESYFEDAVEKERNIVAYCHVGTSYYTDYDNEDGLSVFWGGGSIFYDMFRKLDTRNIIELAVGQGRHVIKYLDMSEHITVVDILQNNLDVCRERYKGVDKISYYCNDGYDLNELSDNTYSALFTYDAMVHFEMMDIYSYLKDIYRVLIPGGMALFHHSNNGNDYRNSFLNNKSNRSFMSKEIFAYLAYKCGFEIVEQHLIDWDSVKNVDCISLVRKPLEKV